MASDTPELISHIPNSGIVQMPGRRFPGVVIQGDSLFSIYGSMRDLIEHFRRIRDEEHFYDALEVAEAIQAQLRHYEDALTSAGLELPYPGSVHDHPISDDFDEGYSSSEN
jgi:hypothetical protein